MYTIFWQNFRIFTVKIAYKFLHYLTSTQGYAVASQFKLNVATTKWGLIVPHENNFRMNEGSVPAKRVPDGAFVWMASIGGVPSDSYLDPILFVNVNIFVRQRTGWGALLPNPIMHEWSRISTTLCYFNLLSVVEGGLYMINPKYFLFLKNMSFRCLDHLLKAYVKEWIGEKCDSYSTEFLKRETELPGSDVPILIFENFSELTKKLETIFFMYLMG